MARKFPDSTTTSVGGFIFLRIICPAIVNPEIIDLDLPDPLHGIQRSLVMITRILQGLANNVRFGPRDSVMKLFNDFMARNMWGMDQYVELASRVSRRKR